MDEQDASSPSFFLSLIPSLSENRCLTRGRVDLKPGKGAEKANEILYLILKTKGLCAERDVICSQYYFIAVHFLITSLQRYLTLLSLLLCVPLLPSFTNSGNPQCLIKQWVVSEYPGESYLTLFTRTYTHVQSRPYFFQFIRQLRFIANKSSFTQLTFYPAHRSTQVRISAIYSAFA